MKKIFIILNPNAKRFRTHRSTMNTFSRIDYPGMKLYTPENINELNTAAKDVFDQKPDYICIGGGDGTIHLVITELLNCFNGTKLPPVLILKEGTMDNIAKTINLEGNGEKIIERMIRALKKDKTIPTFRRDTIEINNRFCFLFGVGFVTNFLKLAYNGIEKGILRNSLVAAITAAEALLNIEEGEVFRRENFSIEADGKQIDLHPINGILSGTVEHIGMGFAPLKHAYDVPGKFQTIIIGMEPRKVLLNIHKIRMGETLHERGYENLHCSELVLSRKGSFDYTMDGDIYTADERLIIKTGPSIELVKV